MAEAAGVTVKKKLKILCIHGYRQNALMFKEKTGALRKIMKKYADLEFLTAPHRVPPGNGGSAAWLQEKNSSAEGTPADGEDSGLGERGWWFSREDDYFKSVDYSDFTKGFDASLEMIVNSLENSDEQFDGVLGFSQGASLVSMLSLIQQQQAKQWFKFAILVAGFKSRCSPHDIYYQGSSCIPSLHVFGETDQIVSESMSAELLKYFTAPVVMRHPGGHFVPAAAQQKKGYVDFLEKMCSHCDIVKPS